MSPPGVEREWEMSGAGSNGLGEHRKGPFVTITIMLAVILMTAACSDSNGAGDDLALASTDVALPLLPQQLASNRTSVMALSTPAAFRNALADILENPNSTDLLTPVGKPLRLSEYSPQTVYRFRQYDPVWVTYEGRFSVKGTMLMHRLANAGIDALDPGAYRVDGIRAAVARGDSRSMALAELMLSHAFLRFSADLWQRAIPDISVLGRAAETDEFGAFLDRLAPGDPGYLRLRDALVKYDTIALVGGWEPVPDGKTLRAGVADTRVVALRRRLAFTGDLTQNVGSESILFGEQVEAAVKRFQIRHGLIADGVVGPRTLTALNVPATVRAEQVAANLQLQRREPVRTGDRTIVVNLAAFELTVFDGGRETLRSSIIIGRPGWETPLMSSELRWLEINPTWSVPHRIATEEILPILRRNGIDYLVKRRFRLYDANRREIDPAGFDFSNLNRERLPFILRQDPGPANPLGNVKFMFPNDDAIYLHDTRRRSLFKRRNRAFSHGCVRVEAADRLAKLLLREEGWTASDYERVLQSGEPHRVRLRKPVPIHIVKRTVWVADDGSIHFRDNADGGVKEQELVLN